MSGGSYRVVKIKGVRHQAAGVRQSVQDSVRLVEAAARRA
jgi:hypothetical protein